MAAALTAHEESQLAQTIEMFEVITQSQPLDCQSLEILKEAYLKLGRHKDVVDTAKRIASAYVQLGQLSSAILEYESILQAYPNDADVERALAEIENRATSFPAPRAAESDSAPRSSQQTKAAPIPSVEIDDGRATMFKLFVDGKHVSSGDFETHWPAHQNSLVPGQVREPFIQTLAERQLVPLETSLRLLTDRARIAFLPIDKYDVDVDLARSVPKDLCLRWCVLPFDRMSKTVLVATSNPFNKQVAQELETHTRCRLLWYLAAPPDLTKVIRRILR